MNIETVRLLCYHLHKDQKDKAGKPYWLHPLRVMENVRQHVLIHENLHYVPPDHVIEAAALHDVLEDTAISAEELALMGVTEEAVVLVQILTRKKAEGETYDQYIDRIIRRTKPDYIWPAAVKIFDLHDNLSRLPSLGPEHQGLAKRYIRAYKKLKKCLESLLGCTLPLRFMEE